LRLTSCCKNVSVWLEPFAIAHSSKWFTTLKLIENDEIAQTVSYCIQNTYLYYALNISLWTRFSTKSTVTTFWTVELLFRSYSFCGYRLFQPFLRSSKYTVNYRGYYEIVRPVLVSATFRRDGDTTRTIFCDEILLIVTSHLVRELYRTTSFMCGLFWLTLNNWNQTRFIWVLRRP